MRMRSVSTAVIGALLLGATNAITYPKYTQCDPRWGKDEMGVKGPGERATICREGCAMTSATMMLAGTTHSALNLECIIHVDW